MANKQIGPLGQNAVFVTSLAGHTQFNIQNLGPDDQVEAYLTWVHPDGYPLRRKIVIAEVGGHAVYTDLFHGANVNVTNQSKDAVISIRTSLD